MSDALFCDTMVISRKGQITLPVRIRKALSLRTGDRLNCVVSGGSRLIIDKPIDFFSLMGSISGPRLPENEEDLLSPEIGRGMMSRDTRHD